MPHFFKISLLIGSSCVAFGQATDITFRGKILMADGSAPGKSVGTQKICSDRNGDGPGPLTDKSGAFLWRMKIDFMNTRRCFIEGTLNGYTSTQVEISNYNPSVSINVELPPIKLTLKGSDPYELGGDAKDVPSKGKPEWDAAMKAVNASDIPGAIVQLKAATETNPKFALAWHNIGILYDYQRNLKEARPAYEKAIEANPKMMTPYVALTRLQVKEKDWAGVQKTVAALLPLDKNILFPEMHLHLAVAQYNQKDLTAAEASARAALNPKAKQKATRAEYVLGRILEAKGDLAGAKAQMTKYLELAPSTEDAAQIKAHIDGMGQAGAPEPELELFP